ncbi:hypothetical protein TURU_148255 [Turdus rufiventris]|nr:hypothetical protein TURU_148255 [Turdus rufiventris]
MALGMKRIKKMYSVQTSPLTMTVFKPQKVRLLYGQRTPRVWNGVGNLENPGRIPPGDRNGVGNLENPDRITPRDRNGLGNLENPDRILPGDRNGLGNLENPDRIHPGDRNGVTVANLWDQAKANTDVEIIYGLFSLKAADPLTAPFAPGSGLLQSLLTPGHPLEKE